MISAHPLTVIEILTVDDDDGDIFNGTPHFIEICTAFELHSIPCTEPPLEFEFPDGLPEMEHPGSTITFRVNERAGG